VSAQTQLDELMHEMRNALTVAKANLEAFIDGKLAPTPQRLDAVLQALSQLESMLEDLRIIGPVVGESARMQSIDVCTLLEREFQAIDASARAKDISLQVTRCAVAAPECRHFLADPLRVGQIVKNVLLNAVRYTPAGGVISIDCSRRADELAITISDSGPGINPSEAQRLFEPGFRGSAAAHVPGSGHGLALVKRFVEGQGGTVSVSSENGHGAIFTVRLPGSIAGPTTASCETCGHGLSSPSAAEN